MLVVSIGLFKCHKEGISWYEPLKALESWQCCLLVWAKLETAAWEQQGQPARSPKPWALVAVRPHWGLQGPYSRCSLIPIWNRRFEPVGVKVPLASQILDPWPDWIARLQGLAIGLPTVTQCVAYPRGRILGAMTLEPSRLEVTLSSGG